MERPARYRNAIVPHIYVDGAAAGIEFYERAFGAVELFRIARSDGTILHAEISICGSVIMMGDPEGAFYGEPRALGGCTAGLHVFVDDNGAFLRRAVMAGACARRQLDSKPYSARARAVASRDTCRTLRMPRPAATSTNGARSSTYATSSGCAWTRSSARR